MAIEAMPEVLTWEERADELVRIFGSYVDLVADLLGSTLRRLTPTNPDLVSSIEAKIAQVSSEAFLRVLTAPETSFRLLWRDNQTDLDKATFLLSALTAEAVREGHDVQIDGELWTAIGDVGFGSTCGMLGNWNVPGLMPIDFGSPNVRSVARDIDASEIELEEFDEVEINHIRTRLEIAGRRIESTRSYLRHFVAWFNRVVIFLKDPVMPTGSSSGSTRRYVGRTFITNPQLPSADEAFLAEALMHEGIHGLLCMEERRKPWVTDELYAIPATIVSPWTGNPLPICPFLQACFVWYGLLHFWCLALEAGSFPTDRVRERISHSLRGFLHGPLVDALKPYEGQISPDILSTVEVMQGRVVESFSGVGARPDSMEL